jgi:hypothetical protein
MECRSVDGEVHGHDTEKCTVMTPTCPVQSVASKIAVYEPEPPDHL